MKELLNKEFNPPMCMFAGEEKSRGNESRWTNCLTPDCYFQKISAFRRLIFFLFSKVHIKSSEIVKWYSEIYLTWIKDESS